MATSPNYAWAEPDNSSLVKNGAQDIRALGDAIDTSVWNVGYGQAGKNKIINGDFNINQRSFTSGTTSNTYNFDRFITEYSGGTLTTSAQTFTPGAAPVAGYESKNFVRLVTSGQSGTSNYAQFNQRIENVRTFAGQTVTISFYAKASTGTPAIAAEVRQEFGSGGSADVFTPAGKVTISTSWERYSMTVAVPSISGKTIGTDEFFALDFWTSAGTDFNTRASSLGIQNVTIDLWGIQLEYGSKATPFQTATGTIQGELAACRYYYARQIANGQSTFMNNGWAATTTIAYFTIPMNGQTRTLTAIDHNLIEAYRNSTGVRYSGGTWALVSYSSNVAVVTYTHGSAVFTQGETVGLLTAASGSFGQHYIGFSGEL
jgi:hypothetical protein